MDTFNPINPMKNPEAKELWLTALESGKYKQGQEKLCDVSEEPATTFPPVAIAGGKLCCLGVLCVVAIEAGVKVEVTIDPDGKVRFDGESSYLPVSVQKWAGMDDMNPLASPDPAGGYFSLADLNDEEAWDFDQIAEAIRENL